jgi:hypothetical protein
MVTQSITEESYTTLHFFVFQLLVHQRQPGPKIGPPCLLQWTI